MIFFESAHLHIMNIVTMDWTFENFNTDLDRLNPDVRKKALEIAKKLMADGKHSESQAIKEAINQAQEWFYDLEG